MLQSKLTHRLLWAGARLMLGAALAASLVMAFGPRIASAYLPLLQWTYVHLDTDNRLISLSVEKRGVISGTEPVYRLIIAPDKMVFVGNRLAVGDPNGRAAVSMLVAYLWQAATMALPLVLAWPARCKWEWPLRLMCLPPILIAVSCVDLPIALWAQVWQSYVDAFSPGMFSPLLTWAHFLQGGGRFVLGLNAAAGSVLIAQKLTLITVLNPARSSQTA
jgi:hypothetical protein